MNASSGAEPFLERLDRRWIFLTLALSVIAALLYEPVFPDRPGELVRPIFDRLESLAPGTPVLVSLDYSPSSAPELEPMAEALTRHALLRGLPLCYLSLWPTGNNMAERLESDLIATEHPEAVYGRDWVTLGFQAGGELLAHAMIDSLGSRFLTDSRGTPLKEIPALAHVVGLGDFGLVVSLSAGTPGLKEWVLYVGDAGGIPLAGGCTGVGAPQFFPYYPRQLMGLMAALKGAAEYEAALARVYPGQVPEVMRATRGMGPQAVAHLVIVGFILLGNGALLRRRSGGSAP
ncbi:MAG TPA: hypothetical protein P5571_03695 [Candidatus Krumholzibacteria bacterium]|nr:hypothetical protein [Candidatus Krumholzibacteria bacterium]HRX50444.1 hypothetical protein [Candidatus Krumholzibacteria bacterium]